MNTYSLEKKIPFCLFILLAKKIILVYSVSFAQTIFLLKKYILEVKLKFKIISPCFENLN